MAHSAFPRPPAYYKLFTDENVAKGAAPQPPPPLKVFQQFGTPLDVDAPLMAPLEEQNVERLYPLENLDPNAELKRLNQMLMDHFLTLLQTLTADGTTREDHSKILNQMEITSINMHHLLNQFRMHQGKETIRATLQAQLKQREELADEIEREMEAANTILQDCWSIINTPQDATAAKDEEEAMAVDTKSNEQTAECLEAAETPMMTDREADRILWKTVTS